jgi:hypothetical protein
MRGNVQLFSLRAGEFAEIHPGGKIIEMEHRFVFAMGAVESPTFAQPHILQVEADKTAIAALYSLPELLF